MPRSSSTVSNDHRTTCTSLSVNKHYATHILSHAHALLESHICLLLGRDITDFLDGGMIWLLRSDCGVVVPGSNRPLCLGGNPILLAQLCKAVVQLFGNFFFLLGINRLVHSSDGRERRGRV